MKVEYLDDELQDSEYGIAESHARNYLDDDESWKESASMEESSDELSSLLGNSNALSGETSQTSTVGTSDFGQKSTKVGTIVTVSAISIFIVITVLVLLFVKRNKTVK